MNADPQRRHLWVAIHGDSSVRQGACRHLIGNDPEAPLAQQSPDATQPWHLLQLTISRDQGGVQDQCGRSYDPVRGVAMHESSVLRGFRNGRGYRLY